MICERYNQRLHAKLAALNNIYAKLIYKTLCPIEPVQAMRTREHLRTVPDEGWEPIAQNTPWGGEYQNLWLRTTVTLPSEAQGKDVYLVPHTGAVEALYFLDGKPRGIINSKNDFIGGMHSAQRICSNANAGTSYEIALECYAGHLDTGTQPYDYYGVDVTATRENCCFRTYERLELAVRREEIWHFVYDLKCVLQMVTSLPDGLDLQAKAKRTLEQVFAHVCQYPADYPEEVWLASVCRAREDMAPLFQKTTHKEAHAGRVGIIGHSHMDSAWQWTMAETARKCARTYSNVLHLMEQYPEYHFIQSSALHLEWMRTLYPDIFEGIRARVKEGRYEPNGGVWVESDGNMPSGESFIRQFLIGQRYTEKYLSYRADTFWLADTFGYSAALPQILRGCGIRYFCTTKISWNEVNPYPMDLFRWRGIDGAEVVTHFHHLHIFPDLDTSVRELRDVRHKEICNAKLIPFGFGDGGGGPTPGMLEDARRTIGLPGAPDMQYTTVSAFMQTAEAEAGKLPAYVGELYLEKHRGVLTQNHAIKQANRRAEIALHDMEFVSTLCGSHRHDEIENYYKILLGNQAHDIISGTSLDEVHAEALEGNHRIIRGAKEAIAADGAALTDGSADHLTLLNTLSFDRDDIVRLENVSGSVQGLPCQRITDVCGRELLSVAPGNIPAFGAVTLSLSDETPAADPSPFVAIDDTLQTPYYRVCFDEAGNMTSLIDIAADRQLCRADTLPLGTLLSAESLPLEWDSYDLDYSTSLKLQPERRLLSRKVVADGALEYRIRSCYAIGQSSTLTQDIIFYANSPRIDYHTLLDLRDKRMVLKAAFPLDIHATTVRSEIQFGYIDRPMTENDALDVVKFEVCNHKWSDISENRYGVALLNDCKYGISARDGVLALTLAQSGAHPDVTAGCGVCEFTYTLLPHDGAMHTENVTKPAYMLNMPPRVLPGALRRPLTPLLDVGCDHVICETIKPSEDVPGAVIARLYEAERTRGICHIRLPEGYTGAYVTNMLEEIEQPLTVKDGCITLPMRPFEIKTVMFTR